MAVQETGRKLLSALRKTGSSAALAETPDTYFNPDELPAFQWLTQYVREHRAFPTPQTFKRETGINTVVTNEPLSYYRAKARDRFLFQSLIDPYGRIREAMQSKRPDAVVEVARQIVALSHSAETARGRGVVDLSTIIDSVADDFNDAMYSSGLRGVTTGWGPVDDTTGGLQNGDLWTLVGRPGRGKTYLHLYSAYAAWQAGHSVLYVSAEMPALQLARRLVGVHTGLNPDLIRKGRLSSRHHQGFFDGITSMKNGIPFHVVAGFFRKTVPVVRAFAEETEPDCIYADASYLIQPEKKRTGSGARREVVSDTVEELKGVATDLNRPVYQTVQFNRQAVRSPQRRDREGDNPIAHLSLERIGETDVVGQVSSVVFGIDLHETMRRRYMGFLKGREGEQGWWMTHYRFNPVDFGYIAPPRAGDRGDEEEGDNPLSQENIDAREE